MNFRSLITRSSMPALAALLLFVLGGVVLSQEKAEKAEKAERTYKAEYKTKNKEFCSNNWSNGDKVSISDLRETTVSSAGSLNIDAGRNGGIKVKGENRSDVLLRACVQAWGISEEAAKGIASSIRINTAGGMVKAEGPDENGWSVSYEARVPNSTDLKLTAHNGGISIGSVEGTLEFETTNGGVSVSDVAGNVKGRTTNGGVNVSLSGSSFKGSGLDVTTTNGGVNLSLPENYAANIETGTVHGGFSSDIPSLSVTTEDLKGDSYGGRTKSRRINMALNGGGPAVRVLTTNGGVRINSAEKAAKY